MKRQVPALLMALIILGISAFSGGCAPSNSEGFAIYLTAGDVPPEQMEALSHVDIAEKPVISPKDIVAYNAVTHEITLTPDAFERMANLEVPVRGKSFLVCVDRALIYWGAFWTPISSISFSGVTIWKPLGTQEPEVITLALGYPSSSFYGGEDPRDNPLVLNSLDKAGKLIAEPGDKLGHSMKGFELYSWTAGGQQHFTLITGTNRNKTLEEIISSEYIVSEDGWVHIHVTSIDTIKAVLGMLPQDEFVSWLAQPRSVELPADSVIFSLPDTQTVETIKEQAVQSGINLQIFD